MKNLEEAKSQFERAVIDDFEAAARRSDLAFDKGDVVLALTPGGTILATARTSEGAHLAFSAGGGSRSSRLEPGLYELVLVDEVPRLYYYASADSSQEIQLNGCAGSGPAKLSTPLGDWMCENAEGGLHDFCQTFVACAAYDLFC